MKWFDFVPDFLVLVFPLIGGIVLLATNFNWIIQIVLVALIVLSMGGNAFIRGS